MGYPMNNSHQTDNTLKTVLIVDGQSDRLYPSVFPLMLIEFEDGLFVSIMNTASGLNNYEFVDTFIYLHLHFHPFL